MAQPGPWQHKEVVSLREEIRSEIATRDRDEPRLVQRFLIARIAALESDDSPAGMLRRYIWVVSALVHHGRHGGLSNAQVESLVEIGFAILRINHIQPQTSHLAFLYGDIHLIRSQIYRQRGDHWRAAWEQELAVRFSRGAGDAWLGFQTFAMANRMLRLGYSDLASRNFELGDVHPDNASFVVRNRLSHMISLRLAGDYDAAALLAEATTARDDVDNNIKLEILWEGFCRHATQTKDLTPMISATQRGGSHFSSSYLIETALWAMGMASRQWLERMPRLSSLARNTTLNLRAAGRAYQCARVLQDGYDFEIPLAIRLNALGNELAEAHSLVAIDKELLVWAAAARWLARSKAVGLADLAWRQYGELSRRLTSGRSDDSLGIKGNSSE